MSRRKKQKHRGPQQGAPAHSSNQRPQQQSQQAGSSGHQGNEPRVIQAENPGIPKGQIPLQSVMTPRRSIFKKQMHQRNVAPPIKKYGLIFYETLQAARADTLNLQTLSSQFDQLNIVIRAEVTTDTADLGSYGKVFTGAAWALIHERRKQDGWYDEPHE